MTTFHVVTLFPQSMDSYLSESILKRAQEDKKIKIKFMESPYFFLLLLFVVGFGWHSVLLRFRKNEEKE